MMEVKSDTEKTPRLPLYKLIQRSDVTNVVLPLFSSKSNNPSTPQQKQTINANSQATWTIMKPNSNPSNSGPTVVQNQLVHYNITNQGSSGGKASSFNDTLRAAKELSVASNIETSGNPRKLTPKYNISPLKKGTKVTKIQFGDSHRLDLSSNIQPIAYPNAESSHYVRKLVLPSDTQAERVSKSTAPSELNSLPIFSNSEVTVTSSGKSFSPFYRPSKDLNRKTPVVPTVTPKDDEKDSDQSQKNSGIAVVRNQLVHYNIVTQGHPNMKLPPLNESKLGMADQGRKFATSKMATKYNNKRRIILSPNMNIAQPAKILVLPPNMESVDPTKKIILPSNPEPTKAPPRSAVHSNLTSPDPTNRFVLSPDATNRGYSQFNQQMSSNDSLKKIILSPKMTSPEHTNRFVLSPSTEAEKRYSNMESTEAANILVLLSNMDSAGASRPVTHSTNTESNGILNGLANMEPVGNAHLSALPSNMDLDDEVQVVPPKATEIEVYDDDDDRKSLFGLDFEMTELVSSADVLKSLIGYKNYNVLLSALCSIKDLATKSKALAAFFSTNKEFRSAHSQTESVQKDTVESRNFVPTTVPTSSNETQTFLPKKQSSFTQTQTVILSPKRKSSFTQTLKQSPRKRTCFTQTETDLARGKTRLAQTQTIALARQQPQPGIFTSSPVKKKNIVDKVNPAAETRPRADQDGSVLDSETTLPEVSEPLEESRQNVSEDPLAYDDNGLLAIHRSVLLHDFEGVRHWGETLRSLGHSVDQRSRPDGYTPLHLALLSGCGADILFQLLGHGASAAVPDGRGRPTLLLAAKPRAPRRGAPAPVASPLLPLLAATQPQALELVCRQTDTQGNTTLMYCARQGWAEQVQLLLEHSSPAVVRLAHRKTGKTALCMAMEAVADRVSSGQPVEPALRCVELLKQASASSPDRGSSASSQKPSSPLQTPVLRKRGSTRALVKETNASNAPPKTKPLREANEKKIVKVAASEASLDELQEPVAVGDQVMGMPVQKVIPCNLKIIFTPSKGEGPDKKCDDARPGSVSLQNIREFKTERMASSEVANFKRETSALEKKPEKGAIKRQPSKRDSLSVSIADSPIQPKKSRKSAANKISEHSKKGALAVIWDADISAIAESGNIKAAQYKRNSLDKIKTPNKIDPLNKSELRTSKRVAGNVDIKASKASRLRSEASQSPPGKRDEARVAGDVTPSKPAAMGEITQIKVFESKMKQATPPNSRKGRAIKDAKNIKLGREKPDMSIICLKSGQIIGNLEANTDCAGAGAGRLVSINKQSEETESNDIILNPLLGDENSLLKESKVKIKRHYVKRAKGCLDKIHRCKRTIQKTKPTQLKTVREKVASSVVSAAKETVCADSGTLEAPINKTVASVSKPRNVGLKTVCKNYSNLIPLDDVVNGKNVVQVSIKNILHKSTLESIAKDKFIQPRVVISPIINRSVRDFFCNKPSRNVRRKFDKQMTTEFDKIAVDIIARLPDEGLATDYDSFRAAESFDVNPTDGREPNVELSQRPVRVLDKKVSTRRKRKYEILAPLKNKWKIKLKLSPTSTKKLRAGGGKPGISSIGEDRVVCDDDREATPPPTADETLISEVIATTAPLETENTEASTDVGENPLSIVGDATVSTPSADVTTVQRDSKKSSFMNVKKLSEQSLQVVNVSTSGSPSTKRVDGANDLLPSSSVTEISDPEQSSDVTDLNKDPTQSSDITNTKPSSGLGDVNKDLKTSVVATVRNDPILSLEDPNSTSDVTNIRKVARQSFDVTKLKIDSKQNPDVTDEENNPKHSSDVSNIKRDPKNVSDNTKLKKDPKPDVSKVSKGSSDKTDPAMRSEDAKGKKISKSSPDVVNVKTQLKLGLDTARVSRIFDRTIPALGKKRRYSLGSIEHDLEIINRAVAMQEAPELPPPVLSYLLLYPN